MSRRKAAWWAACVAVGTTAAVLTAPDSHADSSGFLDDIHSLGWYNSLRGDVGLLDQGYAVCRAMDGGANGQQVATVIYRNTGLDVSLEDAATFVVLAVQNLCPQYDHRGGYTA